MQCVAHAPATLSAVAKALRQRARRASRAEMTPDGAAMHLDAMGEGMRASDARQCLICCFQRKSEKADGGLHDVFEHADLGGKKRRSTRGQRGRYPARAAAHLSLPSNIMASVAALSRLTTGPKDAQPVHRQRWDVGGSSRRVGWAAPESSARCRTKSRCCCSRGTAKTTMAIIHFSQGQVSGA